MKRILCFGDSNTWGFIPGTRERYDEDTRWPGVMAAALGSGYRVIEEGLNGRTTVWDDPFVPFNRNGRAYLPACLESHRPLDLVILMLGSNDLKRQYGVTAYEAARGVGVLIGQIQASGSGKNAQAPPILLMSPPRTGKPAGLLTEMFAGAEEKSRHFAEFYAPMARETGCAYLDAAPFIECSPVDGVHLAPEEHHKLGLAVAAKVREILG